MSLSSPAIRRVIAMSVSTMVVAAMGSIVLPAAGAAPRVATATTNSATAGWVLSGPISGNVNVQAVETSGPVGPNISFFVSEQFCDVAHNQEIFRTFVGQQPVRPDYFVVFHHLAGAILTVPSMPVTGTEQRMPGCTSSTTPQRRSTARTVSLGRSTVSLFASWHATGPIFVRQPGTIARPASALGMELSTGLLNLGDLGASQTAEIDQMTS